MPDFNKPFCFRCGMQPPLYQLELKTNFAGIVEDGPFWPMCGQCIREIDWRDVLIKTTLGMEDDRA